MYCQYNHYKAYLNDLLDVPESNAFGAFFLCFSFLEAVSLACVLSLESHFFIHLSQLIKEEEALLM